VDFDSKLLLFVSSCGLIIIIIVIIIIIIIIIVIIIIIIIILIITIITTVIFVLDRRIRSPCASPARQCLRKTTTVPAW
jgi:hypothetical protein